MGLETTAAEVNALQQRLFSPARRNRIEWARECLSPPAQENAKGSARTAQELTQAERTAIEIRETQARRMAELQRKADAERNAEAHDAAEAQRRKEQRCKLTADRNSDAVKRHQEKIQAEMEEAKKKRTMQEERRAQTTARSPNSPLLLVTLPNSPLRVY